MSPDDHDHGWKIQYVAPPGPQDQTDGAPERGEKEKHGKHQGSGSNAPLDPNSYCHRKQRNHRDANEAAQEDCAGAPQAVPNPAMPFEPALHQEENQRWNPAKAREQDEHY